MSSEKLDAIDLEILRIVQLEARTKLNELAEKVDLSVPAVSERLRKLEESELIQGYHAVVDPYKVGLVITAFIVVISESSTHFPQILKRATANPEVLECHAITGEGSHILKVRTQTTTTLEKLLSQIQAWPGVVATRTSLVLSSPKETTTLPLSHLRDSSS